MTRHKHRFGALIHEHDGDEVNHSHPGADRGGYGPVESWQCPNCAAMFLDQQMMKDHATITCGRKEQ